MSLNSKIEWLDFPGYRPASWNPTRGCTRASEGCRHCYAERMAARFSDPGQWGHGIAEMRNGQARWTSLVELADGYKVDAPIRWRTPRCIFVNSTSDLFHEKLTVSAIHAVFSVMGRCPQHLFIILTKRAERMRSYCYALTPLPNVILGVSVEDQATADERIPHLLATPAACRMVSYEPAIGAVDFFSFDEFDRCLVGPGVIRSGGVQGGTQHEPPEWFDDSYAGIDWIVAGGESGPGARPSQIEWFESVREQCRAAGVAYFQKQLTERGRKLPFDRWPADLQVRQFPEVG